MIKWLVFLAIAAACVISAAIHIGSVKAGRVQHAEPEAPYTPPATPNQSSTCLEYVASGQSPLSQRRYRFRICKVGGEYRAYIEQSPSYRNRATDAHSTHRHYNGRYYICWSQPVRTRDGMIDIARSWAECTQRYIETGISF